MPNSSDSSDSLKERWQAVREMFLSASALPAWDRPAFLDRHCTGDAFLREQVERLLHHLDQAASFLEAPAWIPQDQAPRRFSAGDRMANRFEITACLGAGGMGEVYAAFDGELDETIALKVVSAALTSDPRTLLRLRQEILLARRVAHPNVCRVFDLGKTTEFGVETIFVTMELLAGESLSALLRDRGPLDAAAALPSILQIADGLNAAHKAGVLHRDLKPANIMLVPCQGAPDRAVITDFGLAKRVGPSEFNTTLTKTGEFAGTPAYMAPELLTGSPATMSTDIYAFGVMILEMRTRQTSLADVSLEPSWRQVISRCLSADPAARYRSAAEVAAALRDSVAPRSPVSRRILALVCAALLLLSLAGAGLRFFYRQPAFPEGIEVMIIPAANYTGDRQLDGVTEAFRSQVNQSASANLWDFARLSQVLRSMGRAPDSPLEPTTWREVALRENVPLVVFSDLSRLADVYTFRVRAEAVGRDPAHPQKQWEFATQSSTAAQVFDSVRAASLWLRKITGESAASLSAYDRLPQDTTTSSWQALAIYGRAESAKDRGDATQSVVLLSEVLNLDPDFTLAHARIGDVLMSLGRRREGIAHWQVAVAAASRHHLTLREELRIRAIFAIDTGSFDAAEPPLLVWSQDYVHDYLPLFYLAYVYRAQARLPESAAMLERAARIQPDSYFITASRARTALCAGDYQAVLRASARLRELNHAEVADNFEGAARLMLGEQEKAVAIFTSMTTNASPSVRSAGFALLGRAEAELGRTQPAVEALKRGAEEDTATNDRAAKATKLVGLSWLNRDNPFRARAFALQAIDAYAAPETCLRAATILARLGFRNDAHAVLARLDIPEGLPAFNSIRLRIEGEWKLSRGLVQAAIRDFESASALEPPMASRDYLARALAISGDHERARLIYAETLAHPGAFWQNVETALPGAAREIEQEYRNTKP